MGMEEFIATYGESELNKVNQIRLAGGDPFEASD